VLHTSIALAKILFVNIMILFSKYFNAAGGIMKPAQANLKLEIYLYNEPKIE